MKIFLSYPSDRRTLAERVKLALEGEGHRVFFDRNDLSAGKEFQKTIRREVDSASLMVFFVTPRSISKDTFTRAELEMAEGKWRHPKGQVLPIMVEHVPPKDIPPYLAAVTVEEPKGDKVAAICRLVAKIAKERRWKIGKELVLFTVLITIFSIMFLEINESLINNNKWCLRVTPRMDGKHTHCFASKNECESYQAFAEKSLATTPLRHIEPCKKN